MAPKSVWQTESLTCWEWSEHAGVFKTGQSWPDHSVPGEPARQGLGWQARIGILAVPGLLLRLQKQEDDGEKFNVGSLGRDSSEPKAQCPTRLCKLESPCQAAE